MRALLKIGIAAGVAAVLLGAWDVFIERDGGERDTLLFIMVPAAAWALVLLWIHARGGAGPRGGHP